MAGSKTRKIGSDTEKAAGNRGKGRPKGAQNKVTRQVKEMIIAALDKAGGVDYLVEQAEKSPTAFLSLVGRVLPLQVSGEDGGPMQIIINKPGK